MSELFGWMDLRDMDQGFARLIDADEVVLEAPAATLVLVYPLDVAALRELRPEDGRAVTPGELMWRIDETYRRVYEIERDSQSAPTPTMEERRKAFDAGPKMTEKDVEMLLGKLEAAMQKAEADGADPDTIDASELVPEVLRGAVTLNRPASDRTFGIWGHDLDDLGVSCIEVHEVGGKIWLDPVMES